MHIFCEQVFPLVYSFMERKTKTAYKLLIRKVMEMVPHLAVEDIMADYEGALRQAIIEELPGVPLKGCWFHYCRAVCKYARRCGLSRREVEPTRALCIKMSIALALLPNDKFVEGVQMIENQAGEHINVLRRFLDYIRSQWAGKNVSVYRQSQRTNNSVESFHRGILRLVGRAHPNIWALTECILRIENAKYCDLRRALEGIAPPSTRRLQYKKIDAKIRKSEDRLERDGDVGHFLRCLGHSTDRLLVLFNYENEG